MIRKVINKILENFLSEYARLDRQLQSIFKEADLHVAQFSKKANLHCLPGCGHCCENPAIEVTALEFIPLARELWKMNQVEQWFEAIERKGSQGTCVFYKPDPLISGNGRCGIYRLRPLLCRLYGFSAGKDKYGKKRLITCTRIKAAHKEAFDKINIALQQGADAPLIQNFSKQISQLDPNLGGRYLPINQALKIALEKIGFRKGFIEK